MRITFLGALYNLCHEVNHSTWGTVGYGPGKRPMEHLLHSSIHVGDKGEGRREIGVTADK